MSTTVPRGGSMISAIRFNKQVIKLWMHKNQFCQKKKHTHTTTTKNLGYEVECPGTCIKHRPFPVRAASQADISRYFLKTHLPL